MPKKLEEDLKRQAIKKRLTGKRASAYIYGTMRKTGWRPNVKRNRTTRTS